jgi:hypothetical protein
VVSGELHGTCVRSVQSLVTDCVPASTLLLLHSCARLCPAAACVWRYLSSPSGGTPYSLHSLDASGFEAKEFHLQQVHKPLPDKVSTYMHTALGRWLSCLPCMLCARHQTGAPQLQLHCSTGSTQHLEDAREPACAP